MGNWRAFVAEPELFDFRFVQDTIMALQGKRPHFAPQTQHGNRFGICFAILFRDILLQGRRWRHNEQLTNERSSERPNGRNSLRIHQRFS